MQIGDNCNFKNRTEQLIYLGKNWSGNGYWHQFAKIENPNKVWCEVLDSDLQLIEVTKSIPKKKSITKKTYNKKVLEQLHQELLIYFFSRRGSVK